MITTISAERLQSLAVKVGITFAQAQEIVEFEGVKVEAPTEPVTVSIGCESTAPQSYKIPAPPADFVTDVPFDACRGFVGCYNKVKNEGTVCEICWNDGSTGVRDAQVTHDEGKVK
jgi:hypothetical protein